MKGITRSNSATEIWRRFFSSALFLAAASAFGATAGNAPKPMDLPARVIGHLPLAVPAGNHMVLEKQGEKHYLYIQHASKDGYTVVEVTQPEFASFVKRPESSGDPTADKTEAGAGTLTVAEAPDPTAKTSIRSIPSVAETVNILDVSDPEHPTTLQTFKNVTSFLPDGGRGIFYLTNDEGLWVLKFNRQVNAPAKKKPDCDIYPGLAKKNPADCPDIIPGATRTAKPNSP